MNVLFLLFNSILGKVQQHYSIMLLALLFFFSSDVISIYYVIFCVDDL